MTPPPGLYSGTSTLALVTIPFSLSLSRSVSLTLVFELYSFEFRHLSFIIDHQVARASAFGLGLIYGNVKLKALKIKKNSQIKAEAKAHH
uniref:ATP synthase subunit e, mitochondrial n=1 Tax=Brassica oleracea var. oleracea TaxID=109376 RepID=A0A0D3B9B4_BRAOL